MDVRDAKATRPDRRRRLRRGLRGAALRAAARFAPRGDAPLPDLGKCRRVLVVSVNFRLGNTILATAGVSALLEALPGVELDFLGGPSAAAVFAGFPLRRVRTVARRDLFSPLRLARCVRALRRERYDAALHLSTSTGSFGAFLTGVSGAPHRIGCRRREGNVYFTSTLEPPRSRHKVDQVRELLAGLGIRSDAERTWVVSDAERAWARERLDAALGRGHAPALAFFVGARERKGKGWPLAHFAAVAVGARRRGFEPVVFLGPEEKARAGEIRSALGRALYVEEPDVRRVAALVGACAAALTPDAGPMHLAIAAGTPTLAVFRKANHDRWGPRPPQGRVHHDPQGADPAGALEALLALASQPRARAALA
jgi:ADP-heptose:LPS heptosyltransferase